VNAEGTPNIESDAASIASAEQSLRTRRWAKVLVTCTAIALTLTVARVTQLKLLPPAELDRAAGRRTSERKELAQRGEVLDQRGRPLAMSLVGYKLYCDPAFIYESGWDKAKKASKTDQNAVAECDPFRDAAIALAPVLRLAPQAIDELLKKNVERRYVVLSQEIDEAQVDALRHLDIDGVVLDPFDRPGVIASDDRKLRCARTFELLQFCKTRKQLSALQEIKSRLGDASKICTRDSPSARLRSTFDP
jgi:cell division protein FtsI/penicillin-binding protein 2